MRIIFLTVGFIFTVALATAQTRYMTRNGHISFFSEAPLENIEAHNHQANGIYDAQTGEIAFTVLMRGFQFEKALMQEHFNENYVESHIYPRASFRGKIMDHENIGFKDGQEIQVTVQGDMEIHGVTQSKGVSGTMKLDGGNFIIHAVFPIKLADYDIRIPRIVRNNIAEIVDVTVNVTLEPQ